MKRGMNIVLTGFMGTGKSSVARELSRLLGMKLVDVDEEIERSEKMRISEIFEKFGEPRFRDIETETIRKLAAGDHLIIATGGGAVLKEENMEVLRRSGMIFCLVARPETIYERTRLNGERPLLKTDEPLKRITDLLEYRKPFYERAGTMINTEGKSPQEIAEEIAGRIRCMR